jgi:diaminopimelate epimerase
MSRFTPSVGTVSAMLKFTKAHAYGNDFLYIRHDAVAGLRLDSLARELCDRHTAVGGDGLIVYEPTPDGASMQLLNADGSRAEVSGNGVRALGALLLRHATDSSEATVVIHTEAGDKELTRIGRSGSCQTFRAAMGLPRDLRQTSIVLAGTSVPLVVMDFGNPQCVVLGPLPDEATFRRLGAALERHPLFPAGTNVEFAVVEGRETVRIRIWERGVGPTLSSGTGSCAALIGAAAYGSAAREATVIAPGGAQRVEWRDDSVYLTGWAELLFDGEWLRAETSYSPRKS